MPLSRKPPGCYHHPRIKQVVQEAHASAQLGFFSCGGGWRDCPLWPHVIYAGWWCPGRSNRRQVSTSKHLCGFEYCWCPFLRGMISKISRVNICLSGVQTTNHIQSSSCDDLYYSTKDCCNRHVVCFDLFWESQRLQSPRSTLSANSKVIISIIIHMSLENLTWNPVSSCQPVVTCYDQLQSSGTGWQEGGQRTRHALKRDPKPAWQVSILATKKIEQHRLQDWYGCDWK